MLDKDHCAEKDGTLQGTAHSRQQGLDVDGMSQLARRLQAPLSLKLSLTHIFL
jgi:hypothetical protein